MRKLSYLLVSAFCWWLGTAAAQPRSGAFATRQYRNLFRESGHAQKAIEAKIQATFRPLLDGDKDSPSVVYPAGPDADCPLAYLSDINNNDVRYEGMSYGMMF